MTACTPAHKNRSYDCEHADQLACLRMTMHRMEAVHPPVAQEVSELSGSQCYTNTDTAWQQYL